MVLSCLNLPLREIEIDNLKTASIEAKPYNKKAVPPLGSTAYLNSVDLKF